MFTTEELIRNKAYELGFEKCGIIPIKDLEGYAEKFEERTKKVPASGPFYQRQQRLVNPLLDFPWAKSVVVLTARYGKYKIPEELKGHIAKSYLTDIRTDENTTEYQNSIAMDQFLKDLGLKVAANQKFGIVGLRWAALQAGLGIVRRNNFFYAESGSWVHLEAWLTDKDMELKEVPALPACPKGCNRCITSCPTKSLSEPYTMLPNTCISFLTTFGGRDLVNEPLRKKLGQCIYGCDICQDVCPMNKGKWEEEVDFPGLQKLAFDLTPEKIMEMDENFYKEKVQPKFFYLSPEELWKWKVNVLNFMGNNYKDSYKPYILAACNQENEKIREMAVAIRKELF